MINSRNLEDLKPQVKDLCIKFINQCNQAGVEILITSTYRDFESQAALYEIGRTIKGSNPTTKKPMGNIVTNAKAGQSFHNYRVAFDFVPLINGKAIWDNNQLFTKCGLIAESVGLEWAGHWISFKETAHCQFTNGLKLADFQAGKTI
jgi:peptidoglycan L-alanyl-D-glutamate endopeptidase CwlK